MSYKGSVAHLPFWCVSVTANSSHRAYRNSAALGSIRGGKYVWLKRAFINKFSICTVSTLLQNCLAENLTFKKLGFKNSDPLCALHFENTVRKITPYLYSFLSNNSFYKFIKNFTGTCLFTNELNKYLTSIYPCLSKNILGIFPKITL